MCTWYLSKLCVICTISTVYPGWDLFEMQIGASLARYGLYDLNDLHMFSAGVIDLQGLYNLQDLIDIPVSNMCDLFDLLN